MTLVSFFLAWPALPAAGAALDREEVRRLLDAAAGQKEIRIAADMLAPLFRNPDDLRLAFSMLCGRRDLAEYVLLDENYLPRGALQHQIPLWRRTLVDTIAAQSEFIRDVLWVERHLMPRGPRGHVSSGGWPFFSRELLHDGIVASYIGQLREEVNVAPHAVENPFSDKPFMTKEEREWHLWFTWQLTAGLAGRLDLVKGSVPETWRGRLAVLDKWYESNRRFLRWNEGLMCFDVDLERKARGVDTPKEDRRIPDPGPYAIDTAPMNRTQMAAP
jgi:hypothetical protein